MPYDIKSNYGGCSGYAVVGPGGDIKGCHSTRDKAEAQQRALYANEPEAKVTKAETYKPTSGMQSAAKRALRWKEEGKATGAGTAVGWARANQLAKREPLSLDTVKRMYSFFSRHEVDKKGKDFYNTSNPSNGRIMWDAWGGDGGFTWSRAIVNRANAKKDIIWEDSPFSFRKSTDN